MSLVDLTEQLEAEVLTLTRERDAFKEAYTIVRRCKHMGPCRCVYNADKIVAKAILGGAVGGAI